MKAQRKKKLKSYHQINILKRYLEQQPDNWPKQEVIELAKSIKLSRNQVYKWLWDQRNILRQILKKQQEKGYYNICLNYLGFTEEKGPLKMATKICSTYRKIHLRSQSQNFLLSVPQNIEFAIRIRIAKSTGSYFQTLLRSYGCELTRMRKDSTYETPEKKPRYPAEVNEFTPVPEEKYPSSR